MAKQRWASVRLGLLAIALGASALVLVRAVATPKSDDAATAAPPTLPTEVPLTGWRRVNVTPVKTEDGTVVGQEYTYQRQDQPIDIILRQEISDGNVSRYLFVFSPVREGNAKLETRYKEGMGHYGVLTHEGRAYLTACINAQGDSTVSDQQFYQNRYRHDLQIGRILPWALGQAPLLDLRCLWTLMSVPLPADAESDPAAIAAAYATLEAAWFDWLQWWQANFPEPQ